jgi:hypothetical protein
MWGPVHPCASSWSLSADRARSTRAQLEAVILKFSNLLPPWSRSTRAPVFTAAASSTRVEGKTARPDAGKEQGIEKSCPCCCDSSLREHCYYCWDACMLCCTDRACVTCVTRSIEHYCGRPDTGFINTCSLRSGRSKMLLQYCTPASPARISDANRTLSCKTVQLHLGTSNLLVYVQLSFFFSPNDQRVDDRKGARASFRQVDR